MYDPNIREKKQNGENCAAQQAANFSLIELHYAIYYFIAIEVFTGLRGN